MVVRSCGGHVHRVLLGTETFPFAADECLSLVARALPPNHRFEAPTNGWSWTISFTQHCGGFARVCESLDRSNPLSSLISARLGEVLPRTSKWICPQWLQCNMISSWGGVVWSLLLTPHSHRPSARPKVRVIALDPVRASRELHFL